MEQHSSISGSGPFVAEQNSALTDSHSWLSLGFSRSQLSVVGPSLSWCYWQGPDKPLRALEDSCTLPPGPLPVSLQPPWSSSFPCSGVLYSCQPEHDLLSPSPHPGMSRLPASVHTFSAHGRRSCHCHRDRPAPSFRSGCQCHLPAVCSPLQLGAISPSSKSLLESN